MKKIITFFNIVICILCLFFVTACNIETTKKEVHSCERVCSVCGKCLDPECKEAACLEKCEGHLSVQTIHECSRVCSVCGKCLDPECKEAACLEKCEGHLVEEGPHECSRACSICGKCLDLECKEAACLNKCAGHIVIEDDSPKTFSKFELEPNCEYYEGLKVSDCIRYRKVFTDGTYSDWLSFVEDDMSEPVISNGSLTSSVKVYSKTGEQTISINLPVSNATVNSLTILSNPYITEYSAVNLTPKDLNYSGMKLQAEFSNGKIIDFEPSNSMLSSDILDSGNNEISIKFGNKTVKLNIVIRGFSVKDIKTKSGEYEIECIVAGVTSFRNSTYGYGLVVKDVETDDFIEIYKTGIVGNYSSNDMKLVGLSKGDKITCKVKTVSFTNVTSNGAAANMKFLEPVGTFTDSLKVVSHNNEYNPTFSKENVVEIYSQKDLANFVLAGNNHNKIVKLGGLKAINQIKDYSIMRIFIGNDVGSYNDQKIHLTSSDNCSPIFDSTTLNFNLGSDYINKVFSKTTGGTLYTDPWTSKSDVYALYVGGTTWYQVFTILDESWIKTHDCDLDGHVISNIENYTKQDDAWYGRGYCDACQQEDQEITLQMSTLDELLNKPAGSNVKNVELIVAGFAGDYNVEFSTKVGYILFTDKEGKRITAFNLGNADNVPPNVSVNGYNVLLDGKVLEVGDVIFANEVVYKQAPQYIGDMKASTFVYGGHVDDFSFFEPTVDELYNLSSMGTKMLSGGSNCHIQKIVATKDNPLYISGYYDSASRKNYITFYEPSNGFINSTTLEGNNPSDMKYLNRFLGAIKELMEKNLGTEFFTENFDGFNDSIFDTNLDCSETPLNTYAFEGEVYVFYGFYGTNYVHKILLLPGNTLKLIK